LLNSLKLSLDRRRSRVASSNVGDVLGHQNRNPNESFVGSLDQAQMRRVCRALAIATGCAD
jgi:hypothetical protein